MTETKKSRDAAALRATGNWTITETTDSQNNTRYNIVLTNNDMKNQYTGPRIRSIKQAMSIQRVYGNNVSSAPPHAESDKSPEQPVPNRGNSNSDDDESEEPQRPKRRAPCAPGPSKRRRTATLPTTAVYIYGDTDAIVTHLVAKPPALVATAAAFTDVYTSLALNITSAVQILESKTCRGCQTAVAEATIGKWVFPPLSPTSDKIETKDIAYVCNQCSNKMKRVKRVVYDFVFS